MNSESKYSYNEENFQNKKQDIYDNHCSHSIPGEVFLKCSNGILTRSINLISPTFSQVLDANIANLTIDTSHLRCPTILISFDGILDITNNNLDNSIQSAFTFTLFKICKFKLREAISTFNYNVTAFSSPLLPVISQSSRTLCFQYSACDDQCDDCCTYIFELTSFTTTVDTDININITGKLCVLAVG